MVARINASILLARAPTPALVVVTGTLTCWVGAIVVGPPLSRTRSMILSRGSRLGERFRGFGAAGAGFVTFPGIDTPVDALFVSVVFCVLTAGIDTPLGPVRVSRRFVPAIETPLGLVCVSFRGAGTPSIGTVGWRLGG